MFTCLFSSLLCLPRCLHSCFSMGSTPCSGHTLLFVRISFCKIAFSWGLHVASVYSRLISLTCVVFWLEWTVSCKQMHYPFQQKGSSFRNLMHLFKNVTFFFFKKQFDTEDTRVSPWVSLIFKPCAVAFKQMSMYGVRQLRLKDSNGADVSVEGLPPKPGPKSLTPRK